MVWSIVLSFSFVKTSPVCFLSDSNIYLSGAVEAFSSRNNSGSGYHGDQSRQRGLEDVPSSKDVVSCCMQ